MKVKFLSNCRAMGQHFSIGEVADLPEPTARELIAIGRVESETLKVEDVAAFSTDPKPEPAPPPAARRASRPAPKPAPKED